MSWDPNAGAYDDSYGGYGNYSDQTNQFGANPNAAAAAAAAASGRQSTGPNSSSYDMFGAGGADYGQQQHQQQHQQQPSSFYNPTDYQQPPPATSSSASYYSSQPQQAGFRPPGPTNAYRRFPHSSRSATPSTTTVPDASSPAVGASPYSVYGSPVPGGMGGPSAVPTSQAPPAGPNFSIPGMGGVQMNPVMTDMAMRYGQDMMGKGQEELKKNLEQYVSIGQLKYYFAVDTSYVGRKLALLLFPFSHSDWSIRYSQDEPVQPKYDTNAPDLYIPSMSYLTYVLLVGYVLGLRSAFSPDALAATASSALVWLVLELGCIYLSLTLMNIGTNLCKWDIISFSTYKYVGMIVLVAMGLVARSMTAYYVALAYVSGALAFFLVRTLKLRIEPEVINMQGETASPEAHVHGMQVHGKRKFYMLLFYAGVQPFLMWWMTAHLVITDVVVGF